MDFLAEDEVGAYMKITTPQVLRVLLYLTIISVDRNYNPIPSFVICKFSKAFGDTPDSSPNVRPGGIASQIIETVVIIYQSPT